MRRLRKLIDLSGAERLLLLEALVLVAGIRLGLWLLPFRAMRYLLTRVVSGPRKGRAAWPLPPERVGWGVMVASRCVPAATCLTQALAARVLLAWHGHSAELRLGVGRGAANEFTAHAWLESRGKTIFDTSADRSRYTPLPPLEVERS